jgi:predicted N-acetyltransferase YhbS
MADVNKTTGFDGPRPVRIEELDRTVEMVDYVHRVRFGRRPSMVKDYPHVYGPHNVQNVLIVKDGEKIVCSTGIWCNEIQLGDVRLRVGGINSLSTLPEYRKRGLGTAVMVAAHDRMRHLGCQVGLLRTSVPNWYRKLGWENAGCERKYFIDQGNLVLLPRLPADLECEIGGPESADGILAVRHADRLGGIRSPEVFRQLLVARKISNVVVARRNGDVVAYLLAKDVVVDEWGGSVKAICGLIRPWFEEVDDPAIGTSDRDADENAQKLDGITIASPATGHPLIATLDGLGIPYSTRYSGMLLLLDPAGILDAFGQTDISITEDVGGFRLTRGDDSITVTGREMVKLFFGPERVSGFADDVFPLPVWQWQIDRV